MLLCLGSVFIGWTSRLLVFECILDASGLGWLVGWRMCWFMVGAAVKIGGLYCCRFVFVCGFDCFLICIYH